MIRQVAKKLLKAPIQWLRRTRAKTSLTRLTSHESARLKAIGDALHETLTTKISVEERGSIAPIERRRASLLANPNGPPSRRRQVRASRA